MNTVRRAIRSTAERLRDLQIRLAWRIASFTGDRADPDSDEFSRFLRRAGDVTDPECDEDMMPYWLVSRRVPGPRMPEALESAYFRFRGRRQRDPERARLWRGYILRWAEMQADAPDEAPDTAGTALEEPVRSGPDHPLSDGPASGDSTSRRPASARTISRRSGRIHILSLRRLVAAAALVATVVLGIRALPSLRSPAETELPSASALGIEQLERGSKSLVEQALRARYIETLHRVQRLRISSVGDGMDFERILLEGARLDVERAIDRHRRAGRVPPRLYLLLGKLSLLTEFETDGRRALARAANHGGAVGDEALELLALLPE